MKTVVWDLERKVLGFLELQVEVWGLKTLNPKKYSLRVFATPGFVVMRFRVQGSGSRVHRA